MATTEQAPDFMEPLIGWRYWWLNPWADDTWGHGFNTPESQLIDAAANPVLRSMVAHRLAGAPVVWPNDSPLVAACRCPEVGALRYGSAANCNVSPSAYGIDVAAGYFPCGIYAWRSAGLLLEAIRNTHYYSGGFVFGAVRLWGIVRPHEFGYRAQYAYPDRIVYAVAGYETAQAIADHYRIPYDYEKEVEREYRRAETHYYRRTGQFPRPGNGSLTCGDANCTICAVPDPSASASVKIGDAKLAIQWVSSWNYPLKP